ncbi:coiled-coil domain-containing protein 167 [Hippocampus comes]|uniref:coiled-coil domain-containing protein 167-like n=1 Tax=Hippocampus comes TaxID=109280 RepID=UPI00094E64AD|nr:PREDICTED: coiled-coil domain-containing protein 167-like [Hippocampus comes]XP_019729368.1 PREDICTED: coiled-coil domain-containing protein 167 [Hippocampus comes]
MAKAKDKRRENTSVASEIDHLEERRARCHDNLEKSEFRSRKEKLSEEERQQLEKHMAVMTERMQNLDKELLHLREQNRRNTLLSVALLAICALFYYIFIYDHNEHS